MYDLYVLVECITIPARVLSMTFLQSKFVAPPPIQKGIIFQHSKPFSPWQATFDHLKEEHYPSNLALRLIV
jgi:hypothetical protein